MTDGRSGLREELRRRGVHVGAAIVVAVAFAGYCSAIRAPAGRGATDAVGVRQDRGRTPNYSELRENQRGPNAELYARGLSGLEPAIDPFATVESTEEDRERALAARSRRRAYDGAPPTIPHAVEQRGFPDCLACHEKSVAIGGKIAPRMSHPPYDNCVQCHVVSSDPRPGGSPSLEVENTFAGLPSYGAGVRAWPGAPPTIPHPTSMRSDCSSCHGPTGQVGLHSHHPWRQSCTQCHAPSAELDQRVGAEEGP